MPTVDAPTAQPPGTAPPSGMPTTAWTTAGTMRRSGTGSDGLRLAGLLVVVAALAVAIMLSIAVGTRTIPVGDTWRLLRHPDGTDLSTIIHDLRVPRTLLAILVGLALGVSGVLMQALTLNPLADPGLLGVNLGASFAVVLAIGFLGITDPGGYIWFAFAGAGITSVLVFLLGSTGHRPTPERQVLAGVAITAVLGAIIYAVLVLQRETFDRYRFWEVGSLSERDLTTVRQVAPFIVAGALLSFALAKALNALALGDEAGRSLGVRIVRTRLFGMVAITLLCGAATAAVGPVWFVGLAVPHMARQITGPDNRWVLAYSAVLGPTLLLLADVIGRIAVRPGELQVGIVTAFVGAPVFIALARRRKIQAS